MKIIQKITLSLLAVVAVSSWSTASAAFDLNIDVESGSAVESGNINAATVQKIGAGDLILAGTDNSHLSALTIANGTVTIGSNSNSDAGAMPAAVAFNGGSQLIVDVGNAAVPVLTMTQPGELVANGDSTLAGVTGASKLTISGGGAVTPADLHASTTPVDISGTVNVGAAGHLLPASAVTVLSGGLVDIKGTTMDCMPGTNVVNSGATLQVDDALSVPAAGIAGSGDLFGTLKFGSGSTLRLGAGSSWARNITIGAAI